MTDRFMLVSAVHLILVRDGRVLLLGRLPRRPLLAAEQA